MAAPIIPFSAIPIRTDRTLRAMPYVTYALCLTNIFIYLTNLRLSHPSYTGSTIAGRS